MRDAVMQEPEAELAAAEMFADLLREALLTHYSGPVRPVHRVVIGRLLRGGGGVALVAALDAVREVAGRGESRKVAQEAFVWALTRSEAAPSPPNAASTGDAATGEERADQIGPDAYLLERIAADREAYALDAADIDPAEARQARSDAAEPRALALRHAVHYARRDVASRQPYGKDGTT